MGRGLVYWSGRIKILLFCQNYSTENIVMQTLHMTYCCTSSETRLSFVMRSNPSPVSLVLFSSSYHRKAGQLSNWHLWMEMRTSVVEKLLAEGADPNDQDNWAWASPTLSWSTGPCASTDWPTMSVPAAIDFCYYKSSVTSCGHKIMTSVYLMSP